MGKRRRAVAAVLATMLAAASLSFGLGTVAVPPAAAAANGCGYADSSPNNGKYAGTICWFDFSAFNAAQARLAAGQQLQIGLDGGLTATFTVNVTNLPNSIPMSFEERQTPLEPRFAFGNDAYRGVPGLDALYSLASPRGNKAATITFSNIQVTDASGTPVAGYSFVAADVEDDVTGEYFSWNSDKPLNEIERLAPNGGWGCKSPTGLGTTSVFCAGTGVGSTTLAGGKSTALLVAADSPKSFSTTWVTPARSGIAIGVQTAKLTVTKQVSSRIAPADSFTVSAKNSAGTVVGRGTTGTSNTATTGGLVVAPGGTYTVAEAAAAGSPTNLANYNPSWACTNAASSSTTVLPSGPGATQSVIPAAGDDITCTVTNTAKAAGISLQKIAAAPVDANNNGITDAGDTIAYSFKVTNTGQTDIDTVAIDDSKAGTITCPTAPVAPTNSVTCTANAPYVITAADVTAGAANNTATATAHPLGSPTVMTSSPSSTSTPTVAPAPALRMIKSASPNTAAAYTAGQAITYSFVVRNTGNVPVNDITIDDSTFSGTGALGAVSPASCATGFGLAPNTEVICTASYTLTQADVNAGKVTNSATATGVPVGGPPNITSTPSTATIPVNPAAGVSLVKRATPTTATTPGDVVTYDYDVTNTGNVTLNSASITETAFSGSGTRPAPMCPAVAFIPGQTVTCTATYTLTQADVNAGTVTNTATASAVAPSGPDPVSAPSTAAVTIASSPSLGLVKSADLVGAGVAGDTVNYSFAVTNTGNVTINAVTIDETAFSGSGSLSAITCPATSLNAGQATTCTASYTLTQADVNSGAVTNTATATGTRAGSATPVVSLPSQARVATATNAAIALQKSVTPTTVAASGASVAYTFVITNTGTVDLTDPSVTETAFSGSGTAPTASCAPTLLHPGQTLTCTATYTVTQADADAGTVTNTATATATPPAGITAPVSARSTATLTITASPALTLVKSASPNGQSTFTAGQVITYSFVITNTGNVTLANVTAREAGFTGTGAAPAPVCPAAAAALAPGQQVVCTADYTLTQLDVDAGSVTNAATATGTPPGITPPPPPATSTVKIPQLAAPALTLVKATPTTSVTLAGQLVAYTFTVTNTGNTTLTDPRVIEGAFSGAGKLTTPDCPATASPLLPGQFTVCTASYTTQVADLDGKALVNTATVTASDPQGAPVDSDPSTARIDDVVTLPTGAAPAAGLAFTGIAIGGTVALAVTLLAAGFTVLFLRRRRTA